MITKGIAFIILATLSFAIMNTIAKDLSSFPPMQVVFFRALGTFVFMFPYMLFKRIPILGTHRKILALRAVIGFISLATFFIVLQRMPMGSAISIRYLGPFFGALLSYLFLKEHINFGQIIGFGIAFSGVIILKGFDTRIDMTSLILILISAVFVGIVYTLLRYLGKKEHHLTIINYFMTFSILASLLFFNSWRMPIGKEWFLVLTIGIFGLIGQVFMTLAFKLEETSIIAPFKYMELVFVLILGYFFFGETYSVFAFLGIVMIIVGMLLNVRAKNKGVKSNA